ncbi:MarR family winged helix-turn-helix transcriptional regulator [Microbacterium sp. bgisy207]|jgi:DNA-binding MarR family transcriptional regulator|uniref:MarR family winged helix-turn-helix transcriptional regulator n=1 Tax=Microbacterium sp. bgisy207 TaxID=3413800 RepID=UPI003EB8567C
MSQSAPSEDHPFADEATQVRIGVFRFARRMRTQRAIDSMSDGQFSVLASLVINGPQTPGQLADSERVSAPSMNRTVNCLQDSGYVERSADATDGRKVIVTITESGRAVVEETVKRRDAWVEQTLASLGSSDREVLVRAAAIMQGLAGA